MSRIIYQTITTIKNTEKSQVYLAFMEGREEPVIIKRMSTANPEVYKALAEMHNEHIPQIYACELQENELVVAEEYVDGETLEHYIKENLLTEEQKLKVALQLCEAVEVLHSCEPKIIHRDIKPSNVLITEDGVLKLIDFDASRQYKKSSGDSDTRILGTADYAAPEQFGYQQTDVRSDIYSMGVVFEMLDFQGVTLAKFAWKKMQDICTSFDPKKRYKNVKLLKDAIRRIMWLQKYQWYALGGAACVAVLLVMGIAFMNKLMGEEGKQPNTQVVTTTQETEEAQETQETQESQETQETEETDTVDEEKLASIKQSLESQGAYIAEYYQGEKDIDLFSYADFFEKDIKLSEASLTDLVSGETIHVGSRCRMENSIFMIDAEYMQTLKPSYYRLQVRFVDENGMIVHMRESHIGVFSENETFVENEYSLETNYLDYNYKQYDVLHVILCPNTKYRITGLHMVNVGPIDPSQYQILYDGRALELSASVLEKSKHTQELLFEVEFDNGKRERLVIANPYLR